jgi:hypothetical protein
MRERHNTINTIFRVFFLENSMARLHSIIILPGADDIGEVRQRLAVLDKL